jgi:hypothetical protein
MTTTAENLQSALAGESKAFQKYRAFAKEAEKEGFHLQSPRVGLRTAVVHEASVKWICTASTRDQLEPLCYRPMNEIRTSI